MNTADNRKEATMMNLLITGAISKLDQLDQVEVCAYADTIRNMIGENKQCARLAVALVCSEIGLEAE